ncbi:MAG: hypothetical protein ACRDYA_20810, partial [Egibacteraceae bacterium]
KERVMPSRVPIDGQVLAELREDRFWSQQRLAEQAQAFAKSQREPCALARTQVIGYEAARLDNPKSRYPSRENLCYLVGALRPAMADLSRLVGREPPSVLARWASDAVKPEEPAEQAGTAASNAKESPTDRYELVHKLVPAVAVYVALPKGTDPLRAEVDALTGDYATKPPQQLLPRARWLLNTIARVLPEPMRGEARHRLLVDASEVAAMAGWMALFADHPGEADAYFTQALKFAAQSGVDRALGCALASAAMVHGVDVGSGDSATALAMLQAAERFLPAQGLMTKVVVLRQAEELGALGREHRREGSVTLERGEAIEATDDGEGLYARRGHLVCTEAFLTSWAGRIEVRLERPDEGFARLRQWDSEPHANMRRPAVRLADVALGHTVAGDPEPACGAAVRSLGASQAVGYRVGVERVRRVRGAMPPEWAPLACVRELDERLRVFT